MVMAAWQSRVLLLLSLSALLLCPVSGYRDDDFEEFDEDEAEFDFDVQDDTDQGIYLATQVPNN